MTTANGTWRDRSGSCYRTCDRFNERVLSAHVPPAPKESWATAEQEQEK